MEFEKEISKSEAKYSMQAYKILKSRANKQSSYNLPKEFFEYVTEKKILIKDPYLDYPRKDKDGSAYVLAKDYTFLLGPALLKLIGEDYKESKNEFIASMNQSNKKFQIYRTVYDKMSELDLGYEWFVKLYDNNIAGNKLILNIDEDNKIFTFDIYSIL